MKILGFYVILSRRNPFELGMDLQRRLDQYDIDAAYRAGVADGKVQAVSRLRGVSRHLALLPGGDATSA